MKRLFIALVALGCALPAFAQPDAYYSARPLERRIDQGVRAGQLNRHEAFRLTQMVRDYQRQRRDYLADGRLSGWERDRLQRRYDELSHRIRSARHDRQRDRPYHRPHDGDPSRPMPY
ncbi:hypothetical protein [Crenobacter cavernae]|uniref:DUF4148 domain-containing protein n=1 Tax=Crenobacter cavernae TaxID=2290923 RepID=A0A345Y2K8_9NEIS|nr:hypothetical protein [Crenobacter cavernae]AXK38160.1 hypothetical protein DWG20_01220 [Crenobacter cavernae]